jgi:hypothetical protein
VERGFAICVLIATIIGVSFSAYVTYVPCRTQLELSSWPVHPKCRFSQKGVVWN